MDSKNLAQLNYTIFTELRKRLAGRQKFIEDTVKALVLEAVYTSPEMQSCRSYDPNELRGQLGLTINKAVTMTEDVANAVSNSTSVVFPPISKTLTLMEIHVQPTNFANLLGLSSGHVKTRKGADLHVLDWLLMEGDKTIVRGYDYLPKPPQGRSRLGLMIDRANVFDAWRVPPKYAGYKDDNFVTRAIETDEFAKEVQKVLIAALL